MNQGMLFSALPEPEPEPAIAGERPVERTCRRGHKSVDKCRDCEHDLCSETGCLYRRVQCGPWVVTTGCHLAFYYFCKSHRRIPRQGDGYGVEVPREDQVSVESGKTI
jgi:hypothetical protein